MSLNSCRTFTSSVSMRSRSATIHGPLVYSSTFCTSLSTRLSMPQRSVCPERCSANHSFSSWLAFSSSSLDWFSRVAVTVSRFLRATYPRPSSGVSSACAFKRSISLVYGDSRRLSAERSAIVKAPIVNCTLL